MGTLLLVVWLVLLMGSGPAFNWYSSLLGSLFGQLALFAWSFSVFYHLCNGLRHLFWDVGFGFEIHEYRLTGKIVLLVTFVLTASLWGLIALQ